MSMFWSKPRPCKCFLAFQISNFTSFRTKFQTSTLLSKEMNIKAEVSFEISTGLPAVLYLVERRVGRSKFVRNLESQKTLKLGSFEFLCLVLLQVAKCFVLVQIFCARPKKWITSNATANFCACTQTEFTNCKSSFVLAQYLNKF